MKTRIISGIIMGAIVAAVLTVGLVWEPLIITVAIAIIAAVAIYELLHNAAGIKDKLAVPYQTKCSSGIIVYPKVKTNSYCINLRQNGNLFMQK